MHDTNAGTPTTSPSGSTDADKIESIAQSLVAIYGDRAPDIARRQADGAMPVARKSWAAILMCVNRNLARP